VNALTFRELKNRWDAELGRRAGYDAYRLRTCHRYAYGLLIAAGVMSLIFLAPDSVLIGVASRKLAVAMVRGAFLMLLLIVGFRMDRVRTFRGLSAIVTLCEAAAFAVHLFALSQYARPMFFADTLGFVLGILVVFQIPNRLANMLAISLFGSAAFFVLAARGAYVVAPIEYWIAACYMAVVTALCAAFAWHADRRQLSEFLAKTQLEYASSTDYLTDTANRFRLGQESERWIRFCQRQKLPLSLVFVDVDNLKEVNDHFGHTVGDSVLVDLARNIQAKLRSSDILARWGGDEFVLLLPNASLQNAIALVGRIKDSIQDGRFPLGIRITCSFGIVEMREGTSFQDLLREADALMYDGKHCGRGLIRYTPRVADAPRKDRVSAYEETAGDDANG